MLKNSYKLPNLILIKLNCWKVETHMYSMLTKYFIHFCFWPLALKCHDIRNSKLIIYSDYNIVFRVLKLSLSYITKINGTWSSKIGPNRYIFLWKCMKKFFHLVKCYNKYTFIPSHHLIKNRKMNKKNCQVISSSSLRFWYEVHITVYFGGYDIIYLVYAFNLLLCTSRSQNCFQCHVRIFSCFNIQSENCMHWLCSLTWMFSKYFRSTIYKLDQSYIKSNCVVHIRLWNNLL